MANNKDELFSHDYDGIQEYNNELPRWWVWQFWITIIAMVFYVGYYHLGPGVFPLERLAYEMKAVEGEKSKSTQAHVTEEELLALVGKPEALQVGKSVYEGKCLACHGNAAQGLIGPNLTDDYWIHGGSLLKIRKTIVEGVVEKGMLAWKGLLTDQEINAVTAYIRSLHGTSPPGGKGPEGNFEPIS